MWMMVRRVSGTRSRAVEEIESGERKEEHAENKGVREAGRKIPQILLNHQLIG